MSTITWRNVDKLSSDDMGKSFLDSAQKSINGSIGGLGDIVKGFQATADANQLVAKENATYDFMQRIMAAKTAGEFGANSPELMGALAANGANLDRSKLLPFMDKRGAELQARDTATVALNNAQRIQNELPATEALSLAVAQRNQPEIARILAANPGLASAAGAVNQDRILTEGATKVALDTRVVDKNIAVADQNILASKQNVISDIAKTKNDAEQLNINKQTANDARVARLQETLSKAAAKVSDSQKQSITHPDGAAAVYAGLAIVKDEDTKKELVNMAADAMKDPKNAGMTTSTLINTLLAQKDRQTFLGKWVGTSVHRNSAFVSDLDEARKLDADSAVTRTAMQAVAEEQVGTAREALKNALYPNGAPASVEQDKPPAAAPAAAVENKNKTTTSAKKEAVALLATQATLEQDEVRAGVRPEYSPEVLKYIKDAPARDRAAFVSAIKGIEKAAAPISAGLNDRFSLPGRLMAATGNTLVRGINMLGGSLPVTEEGFTASPYSEALARSNDSNTTPASLKERRAAFEKELAALQKRNSDVSVIRPR